jgi:hypothetical protein
MTPTRILPDLQCSLVCEEVRQEANGNVFLLGILDVVRVPQIPVTAHKLAVFNRWTAGIGLFTEQIRVVAPDQTTVISKSEVKFQMKDPTVNATTVTYFGNVQFSAAGSYFVEVLVDDVMKLRYPINIVIVPMAGGPQGQGQPTQAAPQ